MKPNEIKKSVRIEIGRFMVKGYGLKSVIVPALLKSGYEVDIKPIYPSNNQVISEEIIVYEIQNFILEEGGNKY